MGTPQKILQHLKQQTYGFLLNAPAIVSIRYSDEAHFETVLTRTSLEIKSFCLYRNLFVEGPLPLWETGLNLCIYFTSCF